MIHQAEGITLLLGLTALLFIFLKRKELKRLPDSKILIGGFCVLVAGWVFTVLEGVVWLKLFHVLEHGCYTVSSILVAIWSWKAFMKREEAQP